MAGKPKTLAKVVQLGLGLDLIGSKMSISNKQAEIQVYEWGVKVISKTNGRIIRIYSSNIKGLEEIKAASVDEEQN